MKKVKTRAGKAGLPPGSLVHVGDDDLSRPMLIELFTYNAQEVAEKRLQSIDEFEDATESHVN